MRYDIRRKNCTGVIQGLTYCLRSAYLSPCTPLRRNLASPGLRRTPPQGGHPATRSSALRSPQPVVARQTVVVGDRVVPAPGDEQLPEHALRVVRHGVVQRRVSPPVTVVHVRPSPQHQLAKLRVDILLFFLWVEGVGRALALHACMAPGYECARI